MGRLITLAALLLAVFTIVAPAHAAFEWQHYGADPFATTYDEAMAARPQVFQKFGFSSACTQAAYQAMSVVGQSEQLKRGDHLDKMMSRGYVVHNDVRVEFTPPAPGIETVAAVETWQFDCEGRHYKIGLPQVCNNWVLYDGASPRQSYVPAAVAAPASLGPIGSCANGYSITLHVWSLGSLPDGLRNEAQRLVAIAQERTLNYNGPAFSRTMGYRLRTTPGVHHAPIEAAIEVNLLDPSTRRLMQRLETLRVYAGTGTIRLPIDPHQYIVELVFPDWFASPVPSNGIRRLEDLPLPTEWPDCVQNMHSAVP